MRPTHILAFALLVPLAWATHTPQGACEGGMGMVEVTGGTAQTTLYIDDRNQVTGHGTWHYFETNGVWVGRGPGVFGDDIAMHNLQRGPNSVIIPDDFKDVCVDDPTVVPDAPLPS